MILSQGTAAFMSVSMASKGPGAATGHGPGLTLVLLLLKGAVRC